MQTSVHFRNNTLYLLVTLLIGFTSATVSTQAQTFTRHAMLTPAPASLRVIITALVHSPMLRIRYENQTNSTVRIQIRDRKGSVLVDELKRQPKYAGEFDMSIVPAGVYSVDLQTYTAHHQETVRVELLGGRYPVVTTILPKQTDDFTTQTEWVVNQTTR